MKFIRAILKLRRSMSVALVFCMLTLQAFAAPLTAERVHDNIVKKIGTGGWVVIQERNGITLHGVVTSVGIDSFGLQLHNDPASVVTIAYTDVVRMSVPMSHTGVFLIIAGVVGAGVGGGLILHHEYETHKNQTPPMPTLP